MKIRSQFFVVVTITSIIGAGVLGFLSYQFSKSAAIKNAKDKVDVIGSYTNATLHFFRSQQIPLIKELVDEERYYPEVMSGFAMARNIAQNFKKEQPGYIIKNAAIDPLWEENKADSEEIRVINTFKGDPNLKKLTGFINKKDERYYYRAVPQVMKKKCLKCHGEPDDAPKDQIVIYGDANGYHWKVGDIVSAMFIYVPISDVLKEAKKSSINLILLSALGGFGALMVIVLFLNVKVVTPITKLSSKAEDVSLGKNLEDPVDMTPNQEIGDLSRALDRLRRSISHLMKK